MAAFCDHSARSFDTQVPFFDRLHRENVYERRRPDKKERKENSKVVKKKWPPQFTSSGCRRRRRQRVEDWRLLLERSISEADAAIWWPTPRHYKQSKHITVGELSRHDQVASSSFSSDPVTFLSHPQYANQRARH